VFTTLKLAGRLMIVAAALGAAVVSHPAPAAAATPCWKSLLNDWYDGRIDQTYAVHCYQEALRHLPADVQTYSSAHDDILRALQSAVAQVRKSGHTVGPNTKVTPPGAKPGKGKGSTTTTAAPIGRQPDKGLSHLADQLNPSSASSLPLPLLVLGGLAILLVAAGGAGLVAKRVQARRQSP
jgi:hypothetical protein